MLKTTLHRVVAAVSIAAASSALAQGFVCAEGGGNPGKGVWAEEVFGWMVEKGKNGHVVIIGAVPLDSDDRPDLFKKLGAASVESLVIDQAAADSQATYDAINHASVIFIRGGDQARYVNWWTNTKTQAAIKAVFARGGVVAGTSAGCAVLGELTYDSKVGSLSPSEILHDARHKDLTLTPDFLGFAPGVLFDTHFTERGRLPRLAAMLAVAATDLKRQVVGLGVDPRTAVCISPDGTAEVRGEGTVTFLKINADTSATLLAGKPPMVRKLTYSQWPAGYRLDAKTWEILARPEYVRHVRAIAESARSRGEPKPTVIDGGAKTDDPVHYLAGVCVVARSWTGENPAHAMRAGQMWVCNDPGSTSMWIDVGAQVSVGQDLKMMVGCLGDTPTSLAILNGATLSWAGVSPTDQPAIEGAMLDIVPACEAK
ncbi:MAG: cyanophycinase [Planctomycetes bacterium]|nr:cyanophycinase [Planctomycetota bacterium]